MSEIESEAEISIRSITRAAGVSPQSFYLQFDSLDDVLFEAYSREWERLRQHLAGLLADADSGLSGTERLLLLSGGFCAFGEANATSLRAIFGVRGAPKPGWDPTHLPGTGVVTIFTDTVAGALAEASAPAGADPEDIFRRTLCLMSSLYGLTILRINKPSFPWPPIQPLVEQAVRGSLN